MILDGDDGENDEIDENSVCRGWAAQINSHKLMKSRKKFLPRRHGNSVQAKFSMSRVAAWRL